MKNLTAALTAIAEMRGHDLTEAALELWLRLVEPYPERDLLAALAQHCRQSKWFPQPSEILELVSANPAERAVDQWALVLASFKGHRDRSGLDAAAHKAVASIGGFNAIGHASERDLQWRRKDFLAAYTAYASRADSEALRLANDPEPTPEDRHRAERLTGLLRGSQ